MLNKISDSDSELEMNFHFWCIYIIRKEHNAHVLHVHGWDTALCRHTL